MAYIQNIESRARELCCRSEDLNCTLFAVQEVYNFRNTLLGKYCRSHAQMRLRAAHVSEVE